MIKACIFDLDGVIVDTAHYHFIAWKRLAEDLGINFTEKDNERLKGVSRIKSMDILLDIGKVNMSSEAKNQLADKKNSRFLEFIEKMKPDEIFPGVKNLLKDLRSKEIKIALASSSKNAQKVIERLDIENKFDVIVDGTMIIHTKPDPEIFLLAASRLGIDPTNCLVFEDAEAGVEAALAAGMKCIGIGSSEQLHKSNNVIQKIGDFKYGDLLSL